MGPGILLKTYCTASGVFDHCANHSIFNSGNQIFGTIMCGKFNCIDLVLLLDQPQLRKIDGHYMNWPMTFEELASTFPNLQVGGFYPGPTECRCRGYNAIIVPYRDREEHLR